MMIITLAKLKAQMGELIPTAYLLEKGSALSPAAFDHLAMGGAKIYHADTGTSKMEHETCKYGDALVPKCDALIVFRGKLDSLSAKIVKVGADLADKGCKAELLEGLDGINFAIGEIMKADYIDEQIPEIKYLGLSFDEIKEQSHNSCKFFGIDPMTPPSYKHGSTYAVLNMLRTAARETEVAAVAAYMRGEFCTRPDIVEALNRMSSAFHILMCKELSGK